MYKKIPSKCFRPEIGEQILLILLIEAEIVVLYKNSCREKVESLLNTVSELNRIFLHKNLQKCLCEEITSKQFGYVLIFSQI
jgi:hypothetical protein